MPETVSLYATYTQSFDPPLTGIFATPTRLMPETGQSFEAGIKADVFDKRLSLQAAGYCIDKQNVVAQENFITSVQIGEIRSSGFECSAVGKITDKLSVIANYSYCDARIISDPADEAIGATTAGNRFRGVPFNAANIWTRYNLIDNEFHTLGVGLGFIYTGDRYGDSRRLLRAARLHPLGRRPLLQTAMPQCRSTSRIWAIAPTTAVRSTPTQLPLAPPSMSARRSG